MKVIATALVSAICGYVLAGSPSDEKTIRGNYETLRQAMLHKDLKTIDGLGAPGFKSKHGRVTATAEEMDMEMKQMFASTKKFNRLEMSIKSIKVNGPKAVVISHTVMEAEIVMGTKDKQTHKMVSTGDTRDTWIKMASGWKVKMVEDIPGSKTTIDGKPMKMGM